MRPVLPVVTSCAASCSARVLCFRLWLPCPGSGADGLCGTGAVCRAGAKISLYTMCDGIMKPIDTYLSAVCTCLLARRDHDVTDHVMKRCLLSKPLHEYRMMGVCACIGKRLRKNDVNLLIPSSCFVELHSKREHQLHRYATFFS